MSDSFVTPWTVVHQAPLSTGFPRQEYWSGYPFPSPGDLPNPGIGPTSPALAGGFVPRNHQGRLQGEFPVTGQDVVLNRGDTIQCPAEAGWKRASVDPEKFRF